MTLAELARREPRRRDACPHRHKDSRNLLRGYENEECGLREDGRNRKTAPLRLVLLCEICGISQNRPPDALSRWVKPCCLKYPRHDLSPVV